MTENTEGTKPEPEAPRSTPPQAESDGTPAQETPTPPKLVALVGGMLDHPYLRALVVLGSVLGLLATVGGMVQGGIGCVARQMEASARERDRRAAVALLDAEIAARVSLLTDSLRAAGFEPNAHRRPAHEYERMTRAFTRFLRPRDPHSNDARALTTYAALGALIERDPDPALRTALRYLKGITRGGADRTSLPGGVWTSFPMGDEPDTAMVRFSEPFGDGGWERPVFEVLAGLRLERWTKRETASR